MKHKILIADDSVVIRRVLANVLSEEPDLEVVGTAPDGRLALAKVSQSNPDLIILDVQMPNLDGLDTLKEIRLHYPSLPVVMFSQFTRAGAETTIDALLLGAQDYEEKPRGGNLEESVKRVKENLVPKIRALCRAPKETAEEAAGSPRPRHRKKNRPTASSPFCAEIVVIGTSTGGPSALSSLLSGLPSGLSAPLLIVQHMPAVFTESLAGRLALKTPIKVREARDAESIEEGMARLAPGDNHMAVGLVGGVPKLKVFQGPHVNSCRPSVDVLFQSAAALYGDKVLGVILTGMGQDGLRGCEAIRENGGQVLAQDEASSVVWGMPGAVVHAGLADQVLPLNEIAAAILGKVKGPVDDQVHSERTVMP